MSKIKNHNIEILLSIALAFCIYSYLTTGSDGIWFSRSGSIMVLLAVIAEFQVNNARMSTAETSSSLEIGGSGIVYKRELSPRYNAFTIIAHIEIISGTVICGYGDCLFKSCI